MFSQLLARSRLGDGYEGYGDAVEDAGGADLRIMLEELDEIESGSASRAIRLGLSRFSVGNGLLKGGMGRTRCAYGAKKYDIVSLSCLSRKYAPCI